jgi:hypothetical protein
MKIILLILISTLTASCSVGRIKGKNEDEIRDTLNSRHELLINSTSMPNKPLKIAHQLGNSRDYPKNCRRIKKIDNDTNKFITRLLEKAFTKMEYDGVEFDVRINHKNTADKKVYVTHNRVKINKDEDGYYKRNTLGILLKEFNKDEYKGKKLYIEFKSPFNKEVAERTIEIIKKEVAKARWNDIAFVSFNLKYLHFINNYYKKDSFSLFYIAFCPLKSYKKLKKESSCCTGVWLDGNYHRRKIKRVIQETDAFLQVYPSSYYSSHKHFLKRLKKYTTKREGTNKNFQIPGIIYDSKVIVVK